jgi:hypothetical protein
MQFARGDNKMTPSGPHSISPADELRSERQKKIHKAVTIRNMQRVESEARRGKMCSKKKTFVFIQPLKQKLVVVNK